MATQEHGQVTPAPEDEPDDSDSQGEGEHDGPDGLNRSAEAIGQRLADLVERETVPDDEQADEPTVELEPPDDPYGRRCPTCRGWGIVKTGSIVPGQESRSCLDCGGLGWQDAGRTAQVAPVEPVTFGTAAPAVEAPWTWPQAVAR